MVSTASFIVPEWLMVMILLACISIADPRLDGHQGAVNVARYNHGAKYVLTGSADRSVRLWNPVTGKEIKSYKGHAQEVLHVDMSAPFHVDACCSAD